MAFLEVGGGGGYNIIVCYTGGEFTLSGFSVRCCCSVELKSRSQETVLESLLAAFV